MKLDVDVMLEGGRALTGTEIEALFRQQLEQELLFYVHSAYENAPWSSAVPEVAAEEAEAYRIMRLPGRGLGMRSEDRERLTANGLEASIGTIETYMRQIAASLDDAHVADRLAAIGAPIHDQNISAARRHLLRAGAVACARVSRVFDESTLDAPDPVRALTADLGEPSDEVKALLAANPPQFATTPAKVPDCPFVVFDRRRFSEGIDDIIADLKQEETWKGDCAQQRRIMRTFAWITGDRPRGAYTHIDVDTFKRGLMRLPKDYQFGTMSTPFAEIVAELPPVTPDKKRHAKTVNRDLSTMSRVSKHLAQTVWKPKSPNTLVLDFAAATLAVKSTGDDPRPPWRKEHLVLLFQSPLFTGNDGPLCRLIERAGRGRVYHDAAYWVPLLCYYHHSCREETCGLRADEVLIDHEIPHFTIQDNDVRGRDGELAGEKREARRRKLPLHPELLRLGFADYLRAIREEGHTALFPELYVHEAKRGGAQFYARAWTHMVGWIEDRLPLPRNRAGKGPDIHSIRALGASYYEVDGVNDNMRADVMGHARTTVNGKHYSKRIATEGVTTVLRERFEFMMRYIPIITGTLTPSPICLLPLDKRSRVGAARARKIRSDAGQGKGNEAARSPK